MTLKEMLIAAGYPVEDMFHQECTGSDLFVFKTDLTTAVINQWCKDNDYRFGHFVETFIDQVTGRPMYQIYFQWYE